MSGGRARQNIKREMENKIMNEMEKVEKLIERANVSYEDAKNALVNNDWDLLDAIIELEKQGKTKAPETESFSTNYEEQHAYTSVEQTVRRNKKSGTDESIGAKIKRIIAILWKKGNENYMSMEHKGEQVFNLPLWSVVLAFLLAWEFLAFVFIISLFFDCRYYISGSDDLHIVNDVMEKAGDVVDKAKDEFSKDKN